MTRLLRGATPEQLERATAHLFDVRQYHLTEFGDTEGGESCAGTRD